MPGTAEKIAAQLNTSLRSFEECTTFGGYISGSKVTEKPEILFARLDVKEVLEKAAAMFEARKALTEEAEEEKEEDVMELTKKPEITFEDFEKMQFAVGEIIKCEPVPKSKKLLCSQVKIGKEVKQIVSGGRDGRQKGYGFSELKACKARRCSVGRHAAVRRGCRRQSCAGNTGEKYACRSRDLLTVRVDRNFI